MVSRDDDGAFVDGEPTRDDSSADERDDTKADYEVGYGKPPKRYQWPKGTSGNSGGRKKGSRGLRTDLDDELKAVRTIQLRGKEVKGTAQQLMLRSLAERAAVGDPRAAQLLVDLTLKIFGAADRGGDRQQLCAIDQALLDDLLAAQPGDQESEPSPVAEAGGANGGNRLAPPADCGSPDDPSAGEPAGNTPDDEGPASGDRP